MANRANARSAVTSVVFGAACTLLIGAFACGDEAGKEQAAAPAAPPLGVLELPVSLRTADAAPSDARKVEVSLADVRVDDQLVLTLENGRAPAAEQSDGVLTKLKSALQSPSRARIALHVHSSLPYETAALVLHTAAQAGMHQLALHVRKRGGSGTETGWLNVTAFQTTPRTDDEVAFKSVDPRKWDEFTAVWQAVHDACRSSQSGSCAYVQNSVAKGGNLQIVLHAAGQGVNVNFFRVGIDAAELAAEEQKRKAELATKKEDFLQGRGVSKTDLEQELLEGEPATQALFQFRATEALDESSAISEVMQPLCGTKACGAVVSADGNTLMVRVVSLIGAAFADGSAPPTLAFELPWTEKPKAAPAPAAATGPAPGTTAE